MGSAGERLDCFSARQTRTEPGTVESVCQQTGGQVAAALLVGRLFGKLDS